jgi:hypothetical protein
MQPTTNGIRAALLLILLLAAGCSLRDAKEAALRLAANTLRQSVVSMQSSVPPTQSTLEPSAVAWKGPVPAPAPEPFESVAGQRGDLRIEGPAELRTITCPVERQRLLALGIPRTL